MNVKPAYVLIYPGGTMRIAATQREWLPAPAACRCRDCGRSTRAMGEQYMVHDFLWQAFVGHCDLYEASGPGNCFLCVGCLEALLGRTLVYTDFTDCPLNEGVYGSKTYRQSPRLKARMGTNRSTPVRSST